MQWQFLFPILANTDENVLRRHPGNLSSQFHSTKSSLLIFSSRISTIVPSTIIYCFASQEIREYSTMNKESVPPARPYTEVSLSSILSTPLLLYIIIQLRRTLLHIKSVQLLLSDRKRVSSPKSWSYPRAEGKRSIHYIWSKLSRTRATSSIQRFDSSIWLVHSRQVPPEEEISRCLSWQNFLCRSIQDRCFCVA